MPNEPVRTWPAVATEQRDWETDLYQGCTCGQHMYEGPYSAAVVPPIAMAKLRLPSSAMVAASTGAEAAVRLDTASERYAPSMLSTLVAVEALASARMAGITVPYERVVRAQIGRSVDPDALWVVDVARGVTQALDGGRPMTSTGLRAVHCVLTKRLDPASAGRWRDRQVWIGGSGFGPHYAAFVPPHHDHLPGNLDDLRRFANRTDIPALPLAAIAHAHFQTIHPFVEGNGRAGRASLQGMLARAGLTRNVVLPLSVGLDAAGESYGQALESYRQGDPAPIVSVFAEAALVAADRSRQLLAHLNELRDAWNDRMRARRDSRARPLVDVILQRPVIDSHTVADALDTTVQNAMRPIQPLVDAGVLVESTGHSRNRLWAAPEVLAAVEKCSRRA